MKFGMHCLVYISMKDFYMVTWDKWNGLWVFAVSHIPLCFPSVQLWVMTSELEDANTMLDPLFIEENEEAYRNPTEVKMSQIVLPCHANHCGELSVGQLLKWMDSTACLSGRRSENISVFYFESITSCTGKTDKHSFQFSSSSASLNWWYSCWL